jgi:stage II sporulation SpoD-like protein
MARFPRAVAALAALVVVAALAPVAQPPPASAAGECGSYRSETVPPTTIRVFRTATGAVETVDFRAYVKNVLSREWISSWTTESIRAGALAVKHYAWYQILHWRGYTNAAGSCFDVFDSTRDQVYDPSRPTHAPMAAAVDATWGSIATKSGRIFATYYNAGGVNEPCGARVNGWQMFQWGSQACGLAGMGAAAIMAVYYAGVVVTSAPAVAPPPPPTPSPSPQPTPQPTVAPTPSPAPTSSPPGASPAPLPTASPLPATPAPQPIATPAPPLVLPGGGQVGLVAPPPPPPPDPEPIVVSVADATSGAITEVTAAAEPADARPSTEQLIRRLRTHPAVLFEAAVDAETARRGGVASASRPRFAVQLLVVQLVLDRALAAVPVRLASGG